MPVKPVTRDAITAALKECGPMSVIELVDHLGWGRNRINACMTTARANHPGKFFRIVRYQLQVGVRGARRRSMQPGGGAMHRDRHLTRNTQRPFTAETTCATGRTVRPSANAAKVRRLPVG